MSDVNYAHEFDPSQKGRCKQMVGGRRRGYSICGEAEAAPVHGRELPRPDLVLNTNYAFPPYLLDADGWRIKVSMCLRCGCAIVIGSDGQDPDPIAIHDQWHKENR